MCFQKLWAFSTLLIATIYSTSALADFTGNGRYIITSRLSGKVIDVQGGSTANGANIHAWTYGGGNSQQWDVMSLGNGYYSIRPVHSGKSLDAYSNCFSPGCDIQQYDYWGANNQQWQIVNVGDGYHKIVARHNGMPLDLWQWNTYHGAEVRQWSDGGGRNQHWSFTTPCGYGTPHVIVTGSSSNYLVNGSSVGNNYLNAINTAVSRASPGQRVTVYASGAIGAGAIRLKSDMTFEVCGTMDTGFLTGRGAVEIISASNVSIPYLKMTGRPYFGLRIADAHGLRLGHIDMRLSGGMGIRFERDLPGSTNVRIGSVYGSGSGSHAVETWHINGLEIGTVTARNVGESGLLLQGTTNARVGLVDGSNVATGTGYATLRFANSNGRVGSSYPHNVFVENVISRGGGRGVFCVSNSGGAVIKNVDLANNGSNAILIENCHGVRIDGGKVDGGGEVRLAARAEFPNNSDITISNLNVFNTNVVENPCGINTQWNNVRVTGGTLNVCP